MGYRQANLLIPTCYDNISDLTDLTTNMSRLGPPGLGLMGPSARAHYVCPSHLGRQHARPVICVSSNWDGTGPWTLSIYAPSSHPNPIPTAYNCVSFNMASLWTYGSTLCGTWTLPTGFPSLPNHYEQQLVNLNMSKPIIYGRTSYIQPMIK